MRTLIVLCAVVLAATGCTAEPVVPENAATVSNAAVPQPVPPPVTAPVPAPPVNTAAPVAEAPGLAVEAEGLRLFNPANGAARPLPFGTARGDLLAALAFRGAPGTGTNGECGAGPLDYASWPDGLTLYFQQAEFTGWALDGRAKGAITTASGVGVGSTRQALTAAYAARFSQSTIGTEFAAGDLYGVLDGPGAAARISNMWAGVSCVFR